MSEVTYSVKAASQKTGLSSHVIRIWEKRYGAVRPHRTGTNRRTYSESEIERLTMLRAATTAGHSIGQIADLDDTQLKALAGPMLATSIPAVIPAPPAESPDDLVEQTIEAVRKLNAAALEEVLNEAAKQLGMQGLLQRVIVPLTHRIGELWESGDVTAAEEHFASSHLRTFLGNLSRPYVEDPNAPLLVTGTPLGQHHEMGALIVGAAASGMGWRVANLSSSLPAVEIASAVTRGAARAVALSVVYPGDDPNLPGEMRMLRKLLPPPTEILIGGRAAPDYQDVIEEISARLCRSCEQVCAELSNVRAS